MTNPTARIRRPGWRSRRESADITQEELATRAGLSLRKLKAIEAGQEEPTPKEKRALHAVLKDGPARR